MENGIKIKNGSGIMKYNIKLSKGKININGKEYDIPDEVAKFIIYETSTRDDIIQTRDVYERTIDKSIEYINKYESIKAYYEYIDEDGYDEYNYDEDFKKELLDILKVVSK